MIDSVHEFLRWGPYGLYATSVLMICAIPLGWLYAYIAFVGKRRDITQPDATRMKAAWGGALILALLMFAWRQIASDTTQHELDDFVHWMNTGYFPWFGRLSAPLLDYLSSYAAEGNNLLVRLIAACALVVVLPAVTGLALFGGMALFFLVIVGLVIGMIFAYGFVVGALSAALWCLPGFLLGVPILLYFLFVRLPLQVAYRRAIREGRWPTTAELVLALRKGTLDKADWQSKIMAYKSRKFEAGLNRDMERLGRRIR